MEQLQEYWPHAGDVVFAVSGALCAARHRMDVLGFVLIGTITGIGLTGYAARSSLFFSGLTFLSLPSAGYSHIFAVSMNGLELGYVHVSEQRLHSLERESRRW
jgi:uncharacterized membrane protein YeiH